jgi:DNA-binding PadR family transcriptional regulator
MAAQDESNIDDLGRWTEPAMLVLSSLAGGPKHGYAIIQDVRQIASVTLGPGTLYGALSRLEQRGLIEALPSDDRRRPYKLTAVGASALQRRLSALEQVTRVGLRRLQEAAA